MSIKVSVVIPTLNEEKHIAGLLRDFRKQNNKDFEVLIVDAHSDDKTCEKAKKFINCLPITVVQSKKRHLAYQRNLAAQKAKGEYIFFIDADMHIEPTFIEKLIENIKAHRYLLYLPIHIPHDVDYIDELLYKVLAIFTDASHMTSKPFAYGPAAIFERSFFEHLGGYDESVFVYEDHEIIQRARKQGVHTKLMQDNPVYFSFRRFRAEGRMNLLSKYTLATLHLLVFGKVDKKIFTYEMGGSARYLIKQPQYLDIREKAQKYFDKLLKLIEE